MAWSSSKAQAKTSAKSGLVPRSAGLAVPETLRSWRRSSRTSTCSHNARMAMWRTLPHHSLIAMPRTALLSVK
eukprot:11224122-Lingulodinium_polyedra.AAC.1